ncbi:hypothetical protein XENOCAPTIV_005774 [Xenoophorus captivus]|uniref:EF-hand domain-containing protein n=1 Tax=Xenoophorus captivus TaxID=1517983 RepID=A0ABV0SA92_9TELE
MNEDGLTPEQRVDKIFSKMDKNNDDQISLEEFKEAAKSDPPLSWVEELSRRHAAPCFGFGDLWVEQRCTHMDMIFLLITPYCCPFRGKVKIPAIVRRGTPIISFSFWLLVLI